MKSHTAPPTWQEVGIPQLVVDQVKQLKAGFTLDTLVYQIVFHNTKKLYLQYICDMCGYIHTPTKTTDEVSQCPSCFTKRVRCVQSLKFNKSTKLPLYSRTSTYLSTMMDQMSNNFNTYFGVSSARHLDWEWADDTYYMAFAGGETASDPTPRVAAAKAAILVPYLWDASYDWKLTQHVDKIETHFVSYILGHLHPRKQ